jgi:hypothetical protein
MMADKILLANLSALEGKYGKANVKEIDKACRGLIAADKARGLTTWLVDVSDKTTMKKFGGAAVSTAKSARQNKDAIDAIYKKSRADYLVILDAPDVIPHIDLDNPMMGDGDSAVPSDLPYASDAPFGSREIRSYCAITRVVGRIAGVRAAKTPEFLIGQIANAAKFKSGKRADHMPYFGISAAVWQKSTALSIDNIFGKDKIDNCPPAGPSSVRPRLSLLSHFINCHGSEADPQFYGQRGRQYPVSLTSAEVSKSAKPNTVVAAECCYGAQLFDPALAAGILPIPNAYLQRGAAGFLGSTNIAYGPPEGNGAADLITQYFLIDMLAGASLGRACLQARQKFVQTQKMADPANLKTLGQFILLADPSIQPCLREGPTVKALADVVDYSDARKRRRVAMAAFGHAAAASSAFKTKKSTRLSANVTRQVQTLARERGFSTKTMHAYRVDPGADFSNAMKSRGVEPKVVVVIDRKERPNSSKGPKGVEPVRVLVAHTTDGHIVDMAEYVNR